ncbi:B12-binding domain-containing radical SAM protein, partial [Salinispira pacifica]
MAQEKLRILLISPRADFFARSREFAAYMTESREMKTILHWWNGMGAALQTVAGLTPADHEVAIIDENHEEVTYSEGWDIVGLTGMTQQAERAYEIAEEFRRLGSYVVMGGIHASVMPDEALQHVDTVFAGEAEINWPQFLLDFVEGNPRQLYRQSENACVDMTRIPLPRYDLVARYPYPVIWIQTTRGCPHDCEFCAASIVYGRQYKHKSVEQVAAEIREVRRHWKYAQIGFADDNMFVNRAYTRELLAEFKRLNFAWLAQSDISIARDEALLKELHESGCRIVLIGFESVNKSNMRGLNRNHWKEKMFEHYPEYIYAIQRHGIGIYGSFILGLEEDTAESIPSTIDFINSNNIMGAQASILTPFPGSRLRERLLRENRVSSSEWKWYTGWNSVIVHKNLSADELEEGLLHIYRSIYNPESYRHRAAYFRDICRNLVE